MHTTKCEHTTFIHDGDPRGGVVGIIRFVHGQNWPKRFRHIPTEQIFTFCDATETQRVPGAGLLTAAECVDRPHLLTPLDERLQPLTANWPTAQEINIPFDDLLLFVASYVRNNRIASIESLSVDQVLGLKP